MNWIEANGVVLRAELAGVGGTPLVLIHEMGGQLESWDAVAPALAAGRRVLRYDQRGSGLSEKLAGALAIDDLADDLAALLDRLGFSAPVSVAGCAVGAAVAIHFAARHPEKVAALIAMSPSTFLPDERREAALAAADRLEREGLRATSAPATPAADAFDPAEQLRCRRLGNDPRGVAAMWRMLAGLAIDDDFARIRCPTLVLGGTRDALRPPELCARIADQIPGARFQALATGHVMALDTPELIIEVVGKFLESLDL